MYVCLSLCMWVCACQVPEKSEEKARSPGTGVSGVPSALKPEVCYDYTRISFLESLCGLPAHGLIRASEMTQLKRVFSIHAWKP